MRLKEETVVCVTLATSPYSLGHQHPPRGCQTAVGSNVSADMRVDDVLLVPAVSVGLWRLCPTSLVEKR